MGNDGHAKQVRPLGYYFDPREPGLTSGTVRTWSHEDVKRFGLTLAEPDGGFFVNIGSGKFKIGTLRIEVSIDKYTGLVLHHTVFKVDLVGKHPNGSEEYDFVPLTAAQAANTQIVKQASGLFSDLEGRKLEGLVNNLVSIENPLDCIEVINEVIKGISFIRQVKGELSGKYQALYEDLIEAQSQLDLIEKTLLISGDASALTSVFAYKAISTILYDLRSAAEKFIIHDSGPEAFTYPDPFQEMVLLGKTSLWPPSIIQDQTSTNFDNSTGVSEPYTTLEEYQSIIPQEHVPDPEYYLNIINTSQSSDTTWMDYLSPDEKIGLMVASSDGSGKPSEDTIEHLKKLGLSRMAEQAGNTMNTDNIDKTTGATNYVDPIGDGALNLPEGWEQADYEWIQSVLAGQSGGVSSAMPVQVSDLEDISEEITQALAMEQRAYNSSIVSSVNSAYGIYNSAQSGDGLAIAQNTVNLVSSIDKAVDSYLKLEGGGDGFLSKDMGEQLGKVGAGLNFAGDLIDLTDSLGSGDANETHNIIDYRMAA